MYFSEWVETQPPTRSTVGVFCRLARWSSPRSHLWWRGDRALDFGCHWVLGKRQKKTKTQGAFWKIPQKPWKPTVYVRKVFRIVGVFLEVWAISPGQVGKIIEHNKDQTTEKHILKLPIGKSFRDFFRQKHPGFSRLLGWTFAAALRQTLAPRWDVGRVFMPRHVFGIYIYVRHIYTILYIYIHIIYIYRSYVYIQFGHPVAARWMFVANQFHLPHLRHDGEFRLTSMLFQRTQPPIGSLSPWLCWMNSFTAVVWDLLTVDFVEFSKILQLSFT